MESITSFFANTPLLIFLVPVILILVVLLVVLNKSNKVEIIAQVPVPPVTTTPAPSPVAEVVTQAIPPVSAPVQVIEEVPVQNSSVTATPVTAPIIEVAPEPVVAPEVTVTNPIVEEQIIPPVSSWRPAEPVAVVEEEPVVATQMEITTPVEETISPVVNDLKPTLEFSDSPVVAEDIPPQAIETEVLEMPVVDVSPAMSTEVTPPPLANPVQPTV